MVPRLLGAPTWRFDEARLVCQNHGLDSVAQVELHQDTCDVGFDGVLGDEQDRGYLSVAEAAGDLTEDLTFPFGEIGQRGNRRRLRLPREPRSVDG